MHPGLRVPEAIFRSMSGENVSVEVKRIPSLAHDDNKRAWHGGFAWRSTILSAIEKAHEAIVSAHSVHTHHIVLCTPVDDRVRRRVQHHAQKILRAHVNDGNTTCVARRVYVHVIMAPVCAMRVSGV